MPGPEVSSLEAAGAPPQDEHPLPGQPDGDRRKEQEAVFVSADLDNSGGIDFEEFKNVRGNHGVGEAKLRASFDELDVNKDGFLSLEEFQVPEAQPAVQFQTLGEGRKPLAVEQDLASIREEASIKGELELDELKARTMYQMVEDMHVHNMEKKLLFLTNPQANLISSSKDSIRRLLDAFDITAPKLVINLLRSKGTIADLRGECIAGQFLAPGARKPGAWLGHGSIMGSFPWMSHEEAILAEKSLDSFMADVLIPLATENNAVVITECMHGECFLSSAFHRMMLVQAKKWGGRPPVTVLAIGAELGNFYNNPNLEANWREVKRKSKLWTARERQVLKDVAIEQGKRWGENGLTDMDPNAANYIICDSVDRRGKAFFDKMACNSLKTELVRYLMEDMGLPSIAMKTGCTMRKNRDGSQQSSVSLAQAIDCVEAGQQVLFLDLRERKLPSAQDRAGLIEVSKAQHARLCHDLLSQNEIQTPEIHDVMTTAFFRDVLRGDASAQSKRELHFEPLCVAIRRCRRRVHGGISSDITVGLPPATAEQIQEVWHARRHSLMCPRACTQMCFFFCKNTLPHPSSVISPSPPLLSFSPSLSLSLPFLSHTHLPTQVSWWLAKKSFEDEFVAMCNALKDGRLTRKWLEGQFKWRKMNVPEGMEIGSDDMRELFLWNIWEDRITTAATDLETLFNADGFHSCNVNDLHHTKRLVTSLIKIDRLPVETPIEGLELLRQAWDEHDVAVYLGNRYSLLSDIFYLLYLALGACTVTLTVFHSKAQATNLQHEDTLSKSIFFLALASAFILSVSSFLNPTQRSRQLLSAAASIESIVWRYRARVREFARDSKNALAPEHALRDALADWRETLVASSDLEQTSFKKTYNEVLHVLYVLGHGAGQF